MNHDAMSSAFIQTYTGEMFGLLDPDPGKVNIDDIAHALSMLCRYGGHSNRFYSVAEHSVLMAQYFDDKGHVSLARSALLHDATEAYMGDVIRPLKACLPGYALLEDRLQKVIFKKFDLPKDLPAQVVEADTRICLDERSVLLLPRVWSIDNYFVPLGVGVECWSSQRSQGEFMATFDSLFR